MEHLGLILAAVLALIGSAFSKLLADEFKAWAPSLISFIIAVAVRALPVSRRERSEEEWKSHVCELPGDLSKLIVACGYIFAAWRLHIVWRTTAEPFRYFGKRPFYLRLFGKRVVDVAFALIAIVSLAPLLLIAYVVTLMSSGGPALFRQRRIGRRGKFIEVLKFRTMHASPPERLRKFLDSDPAAAEEWMASRSLRKDLQLTAIGRILRNCSIDELPQLFNILKGDMSIVGPRPISEDAKILLADDTPVLKAPVDDSPSMPPVDDTQRDVDPPDTGP
jgi:hypothetical protein